jgi:hypothetical protein
MNPFNFFRRRPVQAAGALVAAGTLAAGGQAITGGGSSTASVTVRGSQTVLTDGNKQIAEPGTGSGALNGVISTAATEEQVGTLKVAGNTADGDPIDALGAAGNELRKLGVTSVQFTGTPKVPAGGTYAGLGKVANGIDGTAGGLGKKATPER